jgi:hypothetical protein
MNRIAKIALIAIAIFCALPAAHYAAKAEDTTSANQPANQTPNLGAAAATTNGSLMNGPSHDADAPTAASPVVRIKFLGSGWTYDQMAVFTDQQLPLTSTGGCLPQADRYVTEPSDAGHSLFHAILLSAFLNGRQVQFVVSGCYLNFPRIISVSIF